MVRKQYLRYCVWWEFTVIRNNIRVFKNAYLLYLFRNNLFLQNLLLHFANIGNILHCCFLLQSVFLFVIESSPIKCKIYSNFHVSVCPLHNLLRYLVNFQVHGSDPFLSSDRSIPKHFKVFFASYVLVPILGYWISNLFSMARILKADIFVWTRLGSKWTEHSYDSAIEYGLQRVVNKLRAVKMVDCRKTDFFFFIHWTSS